MAVSLSPIFNEQQSDANGDPLVGGKIYTYTAGSSTPQASYTSVTGLTAQANPIILNARGEVDNPIWLTDGLSYKFALYDVNDVLIRTVDNVDGVNDSGSNSSQWVISGVAPTFVSATQFTLVGDQTTEFHVGRRVKLTVTAGTAYGYISVSAYTSLTTVTVVLDSGVLDSGLSAVQLGLLTTDNPSSPILKDSNFRVSGSADKTKRVALEVDGLTTATTRTMTVPDRDFTIAGADELVKAQDFRLTLTTAVPVTTSDVTGATTVYATPYLGNRIALYDGAKWNVRTTAELSLPLGTLTNGQAYDVFCYDNAGVPTLEAAEWANETVTITIASPGVVTWTGHTLVNGNQITLTTTGALPTGLTANTVYFVVNAAANTFQLSLTNGGAAINTSGTQSGVHTAHNPQNRETALVLQDGILSKTGALTRRYLGTFYTTATTTTEDSLSKRFLWNYYNRVNRPLLRRESTASWNYTTATVRQANASTANQLDMVIGVNEDAVSAQLGISFIQTNNTTVAGGMGLDSTSSINIGEGGIIATTAATNCSSSFKYNGLVGVGRHYIAWLETSAALGTTTWYGNLTAIGTTIFSGLSGIVKG